MLFKRIHTASVSEPVKSRDGCIYLYRGMKIMGWIPPKRYRTLYFCWTVLLFVFSTGYLPLGFLFSYIKQIKDFSPGQFLTSIQVAFNAYGSSVKVIILYPQLWRLHKAKELLDKMDGRCKEETELLKIRKAVAFGNNIFLIFTIVYWIYSGSTFLSALLNGRPAWQIYNPFINWHVDTLHLWAFSLIEYTVMSGEVVQVQLADTYPLVFVALLRPHLSNLKERIKKLRTDKNLDNEKHHEELVQCILDHKLILDYCDLIKPLISGTIFTQFLLIGIVLGLTLINVFFFADKWSRVASLVFVIAVMMQTFPLCYLCNLLLEDCKALTYALFHSNWINAEQRYKKTLLHFLHNVQEPIIFKAMGVFHININTNIVVAKFAFSVFTIAKQMNLAARFES